MNSIKDTIMGISTASSIIILDIFHELMPIISTIGIIAGTIVAVHGAIELILKYVRRGK